MSTQKHTPGPWTDIDGKVSGRVVIAANQPKIRRNVAAVGGPNREANARLIAAAPELLAALKLALPCVEYAEIETASKGQNEAHDKCLAALEWIREAIAKAEGNA